MYYEYTNEKYHTYHNQITNYTNYASYTVHVVASTAFSLDISYMYIIIMCIHKHGTACMHIHRCACRTHKCICLYQLLMLTMTIVTSHATYKSYMTGYLHVLLQ